MLVHRANLEQKENQQLKYQTSVSRQLLAEIRAQYDIWHQANMKLQGPYLIPGSEDETLILERVHLLNEYKNFIDQQVYAEHFDSRSNLHSSVLEEFLYYLFKDMLSNFEIQPLLGKSHSFKDLFFMPPNFSEMLAKPYARIEIKDHDFTIGVRVEAILKSRNSLLNEIHQFDILAVAIECKTYLDKTMLEGVATSANQLKARNPNALYIVVMEWIKLTESINLQKYNVIDQLYILRKQKIRIENSAMLQVISRIQFILMSFGIFFNQCAITSPPTGKVALSMA